MWRNKTVNDKNIYQALDRALLWDDGRPTDYLRQKYVRMLLPGDEVDRFHAYAAMHPEENETAYHVQEDIFGPVPEDYWRQCTILSVSNPSISMPDDFFGALVKAPAEFSNQVFDNPQENDLTKKFFVETESEELYLAQFEFIGGTSVDTGIKFDIETDSERKLIQILAEARNGLHAKFMKAIFNNIEERNTNQITSKAQLLKACEEPGSSFVMHPVIYKIIRGWDEFAEPSKANLLIGNYGTLINAQVNLSTLCPKNVPVFFSAPSLAGTVRILDNADLYLVPVCEPNLKMKLVWRAKRGYKINHDHVSRISALG